MKIKISQILVNPDETVINVLKKLNETGERCLIVINKNKNFLELLPMEILEKTF